MTARLYETWKDFAAGNREALARVEAQLTPEEFERFKAHQAEAELQDIKAALYDLALELARVTRQRIQRV